MLAAVASRSDRALDSVRLALQLLAGAQQAPEQLRAYLEETVGTSLALLEQPAEKASVASAEAVSLAVLMSGQPDLKEVFVGLLQSHLKGEAARNALNGLEFAFDANSQSAYFGREVYAAI